MTFSMKASCRKAPSVSLKDTTEKYIKRINRAFPHLTRIRVMREVDIDPSQLVRWHCTSTFMSANASGLEPSRLRNVADTSSSLRASMMAKTFASWKTGDVSR